MSYKWGTHKAPESLYNQFETQLVMSKFCVIYISDYAAPYPGSFINSFLRLRERVMSEGGGSSYGLFRRKRHLVIG